MGLILIQNKHTLAYICIRKIDRKIQNQDMKRRGGDVEIKFKVT